MKTKKIIALVLVLILNLSIMMPAALAADAPPSVVIDGVKVDSSVAPIIVSGNMLAPVDIVTSAFGADVVFNAAKSEVTIKTTAFTVIFTAGSTVCSVNGVNRNLPVAPRMSGNTMMIPISLYARAIGASAAYNATTRTTAITYFTRLRGTLTISGSTTVFPIVQAAADRLIEANSGLSITVAGGGSGTGINDARAGRVHLGMSSREFTEEELRELSVYSVANDGIAVIVHPNNPVKNLTADQVKKIFSGEITNWNQVGGNNAAILVYTRETGSGTRTTFQDLIMDGEAITSRATPFASSALIKSGVARQANAIGYDSIGYVDETIKAVSVNNIMPTSETVLDETYLMSRQLYLCTRGNASGLAVKLIDYIRSAAIQKEIVEAEGYVQVR